MLKLDEDSLLAQTPASNSSLYLAERAAQLAESKKAFDLQLLDTADISSLADYFLICSAKSLTQIKAISESLKTELKKEGYTPIGIECAANSDWHLLDYGDVVIHILHQDQRAFYQLEAFWNHAEQMKPTWQTLQAS